MLGLSLPQLLRAGGARPEPSARSCVLFVLHGGPSQLDLWDMKPAAPAEVRGEFQPMATTVLGTQICEHLPLLARQAHRFSIVRSMTHAAINHNAATCLVTTGSPPPREQIAFTPTENDAPHLGAQVTFGRPNSGGVPTAVSLPDPVSDGPYTCPGQNGGFLGARYAPFSILGDPSDEEFRVEGLDQPVAGELGGRHRLLRVVDAGLGELAHDRRVDELGQYQQRAFALLTAFRRVNTSAAGSLGAPAS